MVYMKKIKIDTSCGSELLEKFESTQYLHGKTIDNAIQMGMLLIIEKCIKKRPDELDVQKEQISKIRARLYKQ